MKTIKKFRSGSAAILALTGILLALPDQAKIKSHSGNLIVEQAGDLPERNRKDLRGIQLNAGNDG